MQGCDSHAIVNTDVTIGRGYIVNLGAVIDYTCVIEECHVGFGAIVKGENRIKTCSKIEVGEEIELC